VSPEERARLREVYDAAAVEFWRERCSLIEPVDSMLKAKYGMEYTVSGYDREELIESTDDRWGGYFMLSTYMAECHGWRAP